MGGWCKPILVFSIVQAEQHNPSLCHVTIHTDIPIYHGNSVISEVLIHGSLLGHEVGEGGRDHDVEARGYGDNHSDLLVKE